MVHGQSDKTLKHFDQQCLHITKDLAFFGAFTVMVKNIGTPALLSESGALSDKVPIFLTMTVSEKRIYI